MISDYFYLDLPIVSEVKLFSHVDWPPGFPLM